MCRDWSLSLLEKAQYDTNSYLIILVCGGVVINALSLQNVLGLGVLMNLGPRLSPKPVLGFGLDPPHLYPSCKVDGELHSPGDAAAPVNTGTEKKLSGWTSYGTKLTSRGRY